MLSTIIGAIIGLIVALPLTIMPTRRFLKPRTERAFYSLSLIPIALIYIGFCFYYRDLAALEAEITGVIVFSVLALWAHFAATSLLIWAYLGHGLWDLLHEVSLGGLDDGVSWTRVPDGYAAFCLVYDVIIAIYIYKRLKLWGTGDGGLDRA